MSDKQTLSKDRGDSIWFPENILAAWFAAAVVILTTSLLFYDITGRSKKKGVFRSKGAAKFVSIGLLVISIAMTASATHHYYARITEISVTALNRAELARERVYKWLYTTMGVCFVVVECVVAWMVFRGIDEGR